MIWATCTHCGKRSKTPIFDWLTAASASFACSIALPGSLAPPIPKGEVTNE